MSKSHINTNDQFHFSFSKQAEKTMNLLLAGLHPVDNGLITDVSKGKIMGSYKSQFYNWIEDDKVRYWIKDMDEAYIVDRKAFRKHLDKYEKKFQMKYYEQGKKVDLTDLYYQISLGTSGLRYETTKTKKNK